MPALVETLVLAQRSVTVLCSGINAFYFATYRSPRWRRRVGAWILCLVNLAFLVEGLYLGLLPRLAPGSMLEDRLQLTVGVLPLLASLAMSAAVLRQWRAGRHRRR